MKYRLFLIFSIILLSCRDNAQIPEHHPEEEVIESHGVITLLFNKRVGSTGTPDFNFKGVPPDISRVYFFHDNGQNNYEPKDISSNDTISFETENNNELIDLTYYQADLLSYLVKKGDTLEITYVNGMPRVKVINRTVPKYENSYDSVRKQVLKINGLESTEINLIFNRDLNVSGFIGKKKILYERELQLIDSLNNNNLISNELTSVLKARNRYNQLNDYYTINSLKPGSGMKIPIMASDFNKQELLNYNFYNRFLLNYAYKTLNKKKGFQGKFGFLPDSKNAFILVSKDSLLQNKTIKGRLLSYLIQDINDNYSNKEFRTYFEMFKDLTDDSILIKSLESKYLLEYEDLKNEVKEVHLIQFNDKNRRLDQILRENLGKVIYVDFWASWCAPCRAAMPESEKLQNKYEGKDITFIYISIDKDLNSWKKASDQENLSTQENNYLAINYPEASFFKSNNLYSIPRYMIFNKKGELVYSNAPGPGSEYLEMVLEEQLGFGIK